VDLLNHSSGLVDFTKSEAFRSMTHAPKGGAAELLALVGAARLRFSPGEKFEYCNTNYLALGLILERLTSEPLADLVRREVLVPAGMTETRFNTPSDSPAAVGMMIGDDPDWKLENMPMPDLALYQGAGGAVSTASDLLRLARHLLAHDFNDALVTIGAGPRVRISPDMQYGLGWIHSEHAGQHLLWHTGSLRGYSHRLLVMPSAGLVMVVLSNFGDAPVGKPPHGQLADALLQVALQEPYQLPSRHSPIKLSEAQAERVVGHYQVSSPSGVRFTVSREQARVYVTITANGKVASSKRRIDPDSADAFFFPFVDAKLTFAGGAQAESLTFEQGAETTRAARTPE